MTLMVVESSSAGNSYVLKSNSEILLIECGVRFKQIQKALNYDLSNVVGVIGSHAHADHMKCVKDVMASGVDVFTGRKTIDALNLSGHRIHEVKPLEQFSIGDFIILRSPLNMTAKDLVT